MIHWSLRAGIIFFSSIVFYLLTGHGTEALLLLILLLVAEFRYYKLITRT